MDGRGRGRRTPATTTARDNILAATTRLRPERQGQQPTAESPQRGNNLENQFQTAETLLQGLTEIANAPGFDYDGPEEQDEVPASDTTPVATNVTTQVATNVTTQVATNVTPGQQVQQVQQDNAAAPPPNPYNNRGGIATPPLPVVDMTEADGNEETPNNNNPPGQPGDAVKRTKLWEVHKQLLTIVEQAFIRPRTRYDEKVAANEVSHRMKAVAKTLELNDSADKVAEAIQNETTADPKAVRVMIREEINAEKKANTGKAKGKATSNSNNNNSQSKNSAGAQQRKGGASQKKKSSSHKSKPGTSAQSNATNAASKKQNKPSAKGKSKQKGRNSSTKKSKSTEASKRK